MEDQQQQQQNKKTSITERSDFEKKLAWTRAVLTNAGTKQEMRDEDYGNLRTFLLDHPIMRAVEEVLDAGTRNLLNERRDAPEFALAINLQ